MKSVSTITGAHNRRLKQASDPSGPCDPTELLLAELADRRARLRELLQWVRTQVAREQEPDADEPTAARTCRPPRRGKPPVP